MSSSKSNLLFAYGSNLFPPRLRARVASVEYLGPAVATGHALRFHKRGIDGSGKADAVRTEASADAVHGVLYNLSEADKARLDIIEGPGYHEVCVRLRTPDEVDCEALMYQARSHARDATLQPFRWYRDLVEAGARYHGFPREYLRLLGEAETRADPNTDRRREAQNILRGAVPPDTFGGT